jgi:hypothetical protein
MAITVKHTKVSTIPDGDDSSLIRPSDWNADHQLVGTVPITNGGTGASDAATALSNLGAYPSSNPAGYGTGSVTSVAAIAGTGISVTGSPITTSGTLNITNTAPDQTVILNAGTGISTSGTYPNFTITNTSPSSGGTVTSVSGTGTVNGISLTGTVTTSGSLTLGGTLGGIANSQLTNSTISGVSLGSNLNALTIGTGLSGTSYNGSAPTTIAIANSGVTAGTYGSAAVIPVIQVNSQGQITSISTQPTNAPAYQGTWNANTNTPTLVSSVGTAGYYYVVSVAGNTTLNGVSGWAVGDWAIFENGVWQKIAGSSSESFTNLTTTNLAVTGLTGYMYANASGNVTAATTIPNAGLTNSAITINGTSTSLGGSISVGTVTSVGATSPVVSSGGNTPTISMPAATGSINGYLTSSDWTTFNNKQAAGNYLVNGGPLGTPSSGTVTNLTGTASININGTVGATTPSTGAFTYLSTSGSTSTTPTLSFNASNSPIAAGATISSSYLQFVLQNKSGTAGASTNYVLSNDLGTDSSYYGEFGMNSSIYSSGTPADFFSLNNGIYFSGHDGDLTVGSGNGYKTYFAWGTTGQSAHVINASGAIGLNTNITGSTNFGTSGQVLTSGGSSATPTWQTPTTGTVTSVAQSFTGGLISVTGSPITSSGTLALSVAGTSGGIPYFSSTSTWASSSVLAANALVVGGGSGVAPSTITTGTGVNTALGVNTGTAGAFVVNGGALGTPSSGTVTNLTGTASININGTVGATTATTGAFTTVSATGVITSTVATGTAPFTVSSTTPVTNLSIGGNATNITASSNTSLTSLANLATVGTIGTGTWNGSVIGSQYGGTGVNNGSNTITIAGSLTHAGAFTQSFTATANTAVTLPAGNTASSNNLLSSATAVGIVTGIPSAATYLRGDGTWSTVSATSANNLAGGALGSVPYQLLSGSTTFLVGNTTTTPQFLTSTGVGGLATAPTYTSSTGSGNVVLATSPTLVTPALGTPSSGVVTNLTGTASININGTVGATTANTGAFTTLSASSTVSGAGFTNYFASPPAIGGTVAAAITGTTITATKFVGVSGGTF